MLTSYVPLPYNACIYRIHAQFPYVSIFVNGLGNLAGGLEFYTAQD